MQYDEYSFAKEPGKKTIESKDGRPLGNEVNFADVSVYSPVTTNTLAGFILLIFSKQKIKKYYLLIFLLLILIRVYSLLNSLMWKRSICSTIATK